MTRSEGFDAADAFNVGQSWRWFHFIPAAATGVEDDVTSLTLYKFLTCVSHTD